MLARLSLAVFVLVALAVPTSARADVPPPPEDTVCGSRKAGDACEVNGAAGTCVTDQCSRLDYSTYARDTSPGTVSWDCLRCRLGAAPPPPPPADNPPADQPAASSPVADQPAAPAAPAETRSGCSVAPPTSAAALILVLAALLRRRRR